MSSGITTLLNTEQASEYLCERGIQRSAATLRQYRVTGDGPAFRKVGTRDVRYSNAALDAWIEKIVGPERTSRADAA